LGSRSGHQDDLPAAPQQMGQAGLVHGLGKLPIDNPAVPHQKAFEVHSQHRRGLFKSAPRLNRIDVTWELLKAHIHHRCPPTFHPVSSGVTLRLARTCSTSAS
jgi:hypothetical protein